MNYFDTLLNLREKRTPFVEIIIVESKGSIPADMGSKALVGLNGLICGTVGGGKIEARAIQHAQKMLATLDQNKNVEFVRWNLRMDIGMNCGGAVSLYFERHFATSWTIAIYGAGHVAQALVRVLLNLDCSILCYDQREEWLNRLPDSPKLKKFNTEKPESCVVQLPATTFFVLMTQGHSTDLPILSTILRSGDPCYVGVIGSASKGAALRKELLTQGVNAARIDRVFCPIGLPLGNHSPQEIAISIAAQLLQVRGTVT